MSNESKTNKKYVGYLSKQYGRQRAVSRNFMKWLLLHKNYNRV